jgi:hypothetical protein
MVGYISNGEHLSAAMNRVDALNGYGFEQLGHSLNALALGMAAF